MAQWNDDKELFDLMKEKLYTPVVGDILDQMGYKHQFLPAAIRPLEALVPADDATENCEVCVQTEPEITEMMNELWKELKAD